MHCTNVCSRIADCRGLWLIRKYDDDVVLTMISVSWHYLPDKYADIILGIAISRNWRNTCTHCYLTVDLNKA